MEMIEILKAVLFGIVEGITEWLPISSTGHMILLNEFVTLNVSEDFWEMFLVVIQLGAILAVVLLFWNKIFPFRFREKPVVQKDIFVLWFKILVACVPAAIVGLAFDDVLDALFYNPWCVAIALIVFGVAFILIENRNKKMMPKITELGAITYRTALMIGILIGVSRTVAAEFTFFLAIPVMLGASLLKLLKFGFSFTGQELVILVAGMAVAFVVSVAVIRFLMGYIKKHDFKIFGWYRIVLGALVLLYFALA